MVIHVKLGLNIELVPEYGLGVYEVPIYELFDSVEASDDTDYSGGFTVPRYKVLNDAVVVEDAPSSPGLFRAFELADSVGPTDTISNTMATSKVLTDAVTVFDLIGMGGNLTIEDTVSATDSSGGKDNVGILLILGERPINSYAFDSQQLN